MSRETDINNVLTFLGHQYDTWNAGNGLKLGSADEHLFDDNLTPEQRGWLADFARWWRSAEAGDFVEILARAFSELLEPAIGESYLRKAARRNYMNPRGDVCHSNDFCDASMVMASAFQAVLGREVALEDNADAKLWDRAWNFAVDNHFWCGVSGWLDEEELETILIIAKNQQSGRITEREIRILVEAYREHME